MLLKSSQCMIQLSRCGILTYKLKKLNQIRSCIAPKSSLIFQNFCRDYCIAGENKERNEYWIGSQPTPGLIQGKLASRLQDNFITDFVANNEEAPDEEWSALREKVFEVTQGHFNKTNFDGKVLDSCFANNNLNLARNYLRYMRKNGIKYNSATVCSYIKICYNNRAICTEEDLAKVAQFTNYLISRFKVFDHTVGEAVIKGLCLNNQWQKCSSILKEMKQYIEPNIATMSAYTICLMVNDEIEKAWSVMSTITQNVSFLQNDVFITWIEKNCSNPDQIEKLLKFFQMKDIIPSKSVCDHLISTYSKFPPEKRLNGTLISIDAAGKCSNCGEELQNAAIDDDEFEQLRDEFLNKVLIRDDIFKNTTPKELNNFFQIVKRRAPFDIVIDGLNVMYMSGTMKSERIYLKYLSNTVRHFVERNQKVLVIGRKHMYNFIKENLSYIMENSTLFLINDLSEDDPYMIYATFYSGPRSCFVTRDLMRSEKFKLSNEKLCLLFKKWQQSHQIFIEYANFNTGRVFFKNPIAFEMAAQPSKYGWHVPYRHDNYSGSDDYGVHEHWLCLKR